MFNLFKTKPTTTFSPIQLHNSTTRKLETFTPLKSGKATIYACGPTVYNHIHVGNLRAFLLPDLMRRTLSYNGIETKLTINFTDFGHLTDDGDAGEDKIMNGMVKAGYEINLDNMLEFVLPYIESFKRDNDRFGNLPADNYTRASDYIKEQIKIIQTLEEKGYTYETADGLYFDIAKFPTYGSLGNIDIAKLKSGARVEVNTEKRHPADFALWKKAELGWESKWGQGFPGWHTECVAMAFATLGKQIDIHTGGEDLMYTHHNGEIAQAECVTSKTFSQFWLHNAHVTVADEKLAKSAGNALTLNELEAKGISPEDYRYWLLTSHYRTRVNFSLEALEAAKTALTRLKRFVYEEYDGILPTEVDPVYEQKFMTAINTDLDTPKVIALLHDVIKDTTLTHGAKLATIQAIDSLLEIGLSKQSDEGTEALGYLSLSDLPTDIAALLEERTAARIACNWPESDRLRDTIEFKGYTVEDGSDDTKISKR